MLLFTEASLNAIDVLNRIAFDSESYWGHSKKMLDVFKREYNLTEAYLEKNSVVNMVLDGNIIGFYAFNMTQEMPELEYFYLKPKYIGKGYGRRLWNEVIKFCEDNKIEAFNFVAGAEVKNYYLKMGAEVIKMLPSKLHTKRKIYAFKMRINAYQT
ncbi:MAG TPA: GNAT family N-acetyltransferase [Clostridia bacterium]|nr:GNAT family N-acetyltransferase [Clostridia bacterium]